MGLSNTAINHDDEDSRLEFMPIRRVCQYCFQEFETTNKIARKCPAHINQPDRKFIARDFGNEPPFKSLPHKWQKTK